MRAGVLTVSDRVSRGEADDVSAATRSRSFCSPTASRCSAGSSRTSATQIASAIADLAADAALVLTTGGTGSPPAT